MNLYDKPSGVQTRWLSFENTTKSRGTAGLENRGSKGHPYDRLEAGETKTLAELEGSGIVTRIWITINDRSPAMLRSLRLDMFWDGSGKPAVSVPLGDFFGVGLGRKTSFENALFSDPEGRSFNCFIPMPFRTGVKITLTNESDRLLPHLFYDVDLLTEVQHSPESLYFHACWRRESPNALGRDFTILPKVTGNGRFLGCNIGVVTDPSYAGAWWGEGEVKVWFGQDENPTLCGTGTEDYIGTGWGQGKYSQRTQGCLVADSARGQWAFYRYHVDDPIYFDDSCRIAIQTIGGTSLEKVLELQDKGIPLIPVTLGHGNIGDMIHLMHLPQPVDLRSFGITDGWCNFYRLDDWSATAYFYLDRPENDLPALAPVSERTAGLIASNDETRADA